MSTKGQSDSNACWGVLWRSIVFIPYMLAVFIGVGIVWLGLWVLPVCAAWFLYSRDGWFATASLALWALAVWSYRRFRLARFYESPPSLL